MSGSDSPLNLLILGAGVYVCGRGTDGFGTVLPAVHQAAREGLAVRLGVAATSAESLAALRSKQRQIETRLGVTLPTETWPKSGTDPNAYRTALGTGRFDAAIIATPDPSWRRPRSRRVCTRFWSNRSSRTSPTAPTWCAVRPRRASTARWSFTSGTTRPTG